jgi:hypothetical protein
LLYKALRRDTVKVKREMIVDQEQRSWCGKEAAVGDKEYSPDCQDDV